MGACGETSGALGLEGEGAPVVSPARVGESMSFELPSAEGPMLAEGGAESRFRGAAPARRVTGLCRACGWAVWGCGCPGGHFLGLAGSPEVLPRICVCGAVGARPVPGACPCHSPARPVVSR